MGGSAGAHHPVGMRQSPAVPSETRWHSATTRTPAPGPPHLLGLSGRSSPSMGS